MPLTEVSDNKKNIQPEKVGAYCEERKKCGRMGGNTMMPTTTTMKQ